MTFNIEIISPSDLALQGAAFDVFTYLRPHLSKEEFLKRITTQFKTGYQMICIRDAEKVVAAAGFRFATFLAWGKILYIDDLITHPEHKNKGYGGALLDWLSELAKQEACDEVHLDTGYQRLDAHRLYLNKGFHLASHHMSKKVN